MNSALLIIMVISLSGLIAYLGDQIGMKAGKKRISIFGLRPRYSSIIITVATGVLIASLSITILLLTYSGLRQALFNINQVLNRLENLNQQLELKDSELEEMQLEIDDKTLELEELQETKDSLEKELDNTKDDLSSTRQELDDTKKELDDTKKELVQAEDNLDRAQDDIKEMELEREELNNRITELQTERNSLEEKISELNADIEEKEESYDLLKEDAELLGSLYSTYSDLYSSYRGEDLVYQKGEIIYSDVLEAGQSEAETIAALENFLSRADREASRKPIRVDPETGMALRLKQEEILNIARVLYNMEEGKRVIVRLMARVNVSEGDWLLADFLNLIEDKVVFEEGEEIITREIDGSLETQKIQSDLQDLLEEINEKAVEKGLIHDVHGEVGNFNFNEYYKILNEIESNQTQVEVKVSAKKNIRRQDTLKASNLKFDILTVEE
ncbi:MAG: DUF3084 domain-containing protein [Halanaerobiaceae bacterium]